MEQIVGGIRPGEEAQVQQAKVVQRIQANLERLAALGQLAHAVLPQSVHEVSTPVSEATRMQSLYQCSKSTPLFSSKYFKCWPTSCHAHCLPVKLISV
jgi:hypothetical protein